MLPVAKRSIENLLKSDNGILLGHGLANKLNVHLGDLVKLKTAYFNKNICIDKQAVSSEQGISEIRLEIAERCSDITDEDLMNELKSNSDKIDKLEQKVSEVGKQLDMITEMMKTVMPKDKI